MTHDHHILLVEDDDAHAELISLELDRNEPGCSVDRVRDGEAAIAYVRGDRPYLGRRMPSLIILDLRLPKVDGHEVLGELKQDARLRVVPIVVLTTSAAASDRQRAYRAHANSYVTKPLDFDKFRGLMQELYGYWTGRNETVEVWYEADAGGG